MNRHWRAVMEVEHLEPSRFVRRTRVCVCVCKFGRHSSAAMESEDYLVSMPSSSCCEGLAQLRRLSSLRSARFFRSGAGT